MKQMIAMTMIVFVSSYVVSLPLLHSSKVLLTCGKSPEYTGTHVLHRNDLRS